MKSSLKRVVGARMIWALSRAGHAMAAYCASGALIGVAIGYFNWSKQGGHGVGESIVATIRFCAVAEGIMSAILALLVTLPLFYFLYGLMPSQIKFSKPVFLFLIFPCVCLQTLGPALLATLYLTMPGKADWLQFLAPQGDVGDILMRSQCGFLLLGSWSGALLLVLVWNQKGATRSSNGSRLLPLD